MSKDEIIREYCHRCGIVTETVLQVLSSGHVGRLCAVCRTCRLGRPYASKNEYSEIKAEGRRMARGHASERPQEI